MKRLIYTVTLLLILCACSAKNSELTEMNEGAATGLVPNRVLTLKVEDVNSDDEIYVKLRKLGGVVNVELSLDSKNSNNVISVYYNDQMIREEKVIKTVEAINNGRFIILSKNSSAFQAQINGCNSDEQCLKENSISASSNSFEFPNILDILSSIIVG